MADADKKARLAALVGDEDMAEAMIREEMESVVTAALGRKEVEAGITASAVRKDEETEEVKAVEEKEEAPSEIEIELPDGSVVKAAREDIVQKAQAGITRSELKSILSELMDEKMAGLRADVLKEVKKETNSELPRAIRYRVTQHGTKAETAEEHKEAEAVKAGINGNVREEFWKGLTGGHPSN